MLFKQVGSPFGRLAQPGRALRLQRSRTRTSDLRLCANVQVAASETYTSTYTWTPWHTVVPRPGDVLRKDR